jgi:AraC-like DNA-binding protein
MVLQIRNMESDRCIAMVENELNKLGLGYKTVELGNVELNEIISTENLLLIGKALKNAGFELMENKKKVLIENVKAAVFQLLYLSDDQPKQNVSNFISKKVNYDYTYLSTIFSNIEGLTIEKYYIQQRIERAKELLIFESFSLCDIAFKLQYSSVAHLSNQFKKVTGLTPAYFRQVRTKERQLS